ncbi:auxin-binding protein ABP20-like [Arachis duranensis]|uniref:Germin-like protein n=1 Tax=Arachis duranensis TaxID=130453 RepID=A0A6P4C0X8_ARADU|nr:auxin-binding protein ABP20-like [Arachis duranensis]
MSLIDSFSHNKMWSNIFLFALLFSTYNNVAVQSFCVADLKGAQTPEGFLCKPPTSVKVDDFILSGLKPPTTPPSSNSSKITLTPAFVQQIPGLNGLGFAVARLDMDVGGVVPLHSHPDASEMLIIVRGTVTAGFIAADNSVFVKRLRSGDVMVLPQGLLHFQLNSGNGKALVHLAFSSSNPSTQLLDVALFGSNLNSDLITKTTLLDLSEVKKLKAVFGGSG